MTAFALGDSQLRLEPLRINLIEVLSVLRSPRQLRCELELPKVVEELWRSAFPQYIPPDLISAITPRVQIVDKIINSAGEEGALGFDYSTHTILVARGYIEKLGPNISGLALRHEIEHAFDNVTIASLDSTSIPNASFLKKIDPKVRDAARILHEQYGFGASEQQQAALRFNARLTPLTLDALADLSLSPLASCAVERAMKFMNKAPKEPSSVCILLARRAPLLTLRRLELLIQEAQTVGVQELGSQHPDDPTVFTEVKLRQSIDFRKAFAKRESGTNSKEELDFSILGEGLILPSGQPCTRRLNIGKFALTGHSIGPANHKLQPTFITPWEWAIPELKIVACRHYNNAQVTALVAQAVLKRREPISAKTAENTIQAEFLLVADKSNDTYLPLPYSALARPELLLARRMKAAKILTPALRKDLPCFGDQAFFSSRPPAALEPYTNPICISGWFGLDRTSLQIPAPLPLVKGKKTAPPQTIAAFDQHTVRTDAPVVSRGTMEQLLPGRLFTSAHIIASATTADGYHGIVVQFTRPPLPTTKESDGSRGGDEILLCLAGEYDQHLDGSKAPRGCLLSPAEVARNRVRRLEPNGPGVEVTPLIDTTHQLKVPAQVFSPSNDISDSTEPMTDVCLQIPGLSGIKMSQLRIIVRRVNDPDRPHVTGEVVVGEISNSPRHVVKSIRSFPIELDQHDKPVILPLRTAEEPLPCEASIAEAALAVQKFCAARGSHSHFAFRPLLHSPLLPGPSLKADLTFKDTVGVQHRVFFYNGDHNRSGECPRELAALCAHIGTENIKTHVVCLHVGTAAQLQGNIQSSLGLVFPDNFQICDLDEFLTTLGHPEALAAAKTIVEKDTDRAVLRFNLRAAFEHSEHKDSERSSATSCATLDVRVNGLREQISELTDATLEFDRLHPALGRRYLLELAYLMLSLHEQEDLQTRDSLGTAFQLIFPEAGKHIDQTDYRLALLESIREEIAADVAHLAATPNSEALELDDSDIAGSDDELPVAPACDRRYELYNIDHTLHVKVAHLIPPVSATTPSEEERNSSPPANPSISPTINEAATGTLGLQTHSANGHETETQITADAAQLAPATTTPLTNPASIALGADTGKTMDATVQTDAPPLKNGRTPAIAPRLGNNGSHHANQAPPVGADNFCSNYWMPVAPQVLDKTRPKSLDEIPLVTRVHIELEALSATGLFKRADINVAARGILPQTHRGFGPDYTEEERFAAVLRYELGIRPALSIKTFLFDVLREAGKRRDSNIDVGSISNVLGEQAFYSTERKHAPWKALHLSEYFSRTGALLQAIFTQQRLRLPEKVFAARKLLHDKLPGVSGTARAHTREALYLLTKHTMLGDWQLAQARDSSPSLTVREIQPATRVVIHRAAVFATAHQPASVSAPVRKQASEPTTQKPATKRGKAKRGVALVDRGRSEPTRRPEVIPERHASLDDFLNRLKTSPVPVPRQVAFAARQVHPVSGRQPIRREMTDQPSLRVTFADWIPESAATGSILSPEQILELFCDFWDIQREDISLLRAIDEYPLSFLMSSKIPWIEMPDPAQTADSVQSQAPAFPSFRSADLLQQLLRYRAQPDDILLLNEGPNAELSKTVSPLEYLLRLHVTMIRISQHAAGDSLGRTLMSSNQGEYDKSVRGKMQDNPRLTPLLPILALYAGEIALVLRHAHYQRHLTANLPPPLRVAPLATLEVPVRTLAEIYNQFGTAGLKVISDAKREVLATFGLRERAIPDATAADGFEHITHPDDGKTFIPIRICPASVNQLWFPEIAEHMREQGPPIEDEGLADIIEDVARFMDELDFKVINGSPGSSLTVKDFLAKLFRGGNLILIRLHTHSIVPKNLPRVIATEEGISQLLPLLQTYDENTFPGGTPEFFDEVNWAIYASIYLIHAKCIIRDFMKLNTGEDDAPAEQAPSDIDEIFYLSPTTVVFEGCAAKR